MWTTMGNPIGCLSRERLFKFFFEPVYRFFFVLFLLKQHYDGPF